MSATYKYESATIIRVVTILGIVACLCVVGIASLAWTHHPVPDALASVAGGSVGALATLLATYLPSPVPGGRRTADTPVENIATPPPAGAEGGVAFTPKAGPGS